MNNKKKVAFLAPETKGGPYYIYRDLVDGLRERYSDKLEICFLSSRKDWLKLHFANFDFIFSVVPFLFKPLGANKFIYNLKGNYQVEKKRNGLGNKLLYLAGMNLYFADKIMLTSYFLADKLDFRKKYNDKIIIIPNFIDTGKEKITSRKSLMGGTLKLLTISSTKFREKGKGILDLGNQISQIKNQDIRRTIIAGGDNHNKKLLQKEFYKIKFGNNLKIDWLDWVEKNNLKNYYQNSDIFVYGTKLDTWGITIMEAMRYGLPVLLTEYELWKYIYPNEITNKDISKNISKVLDKYEHFSKISVDFVQEFSKLKIVDKLFRFMNQ